MPPRARSRSRSRILPIASGSRIWAGLRPTTRSALAYHHRRPYTVPELSQGPRPPQLLAAPKASNASLIELGCLHRNS
ncbi:hypothetical protein CBM2623_B30403 [Cupriavidus taiwanensis]|nr:hypothetical protein CBM2608_B30401 [Cupriavidus taiwanensis]SPA34847.1 hypothetical protein CBM2623_B30403 [Cupriavidus taiwanensis]